METQSRSQNNSRLVLMMIAGLPLTMILMGTWLWYFVVRGDLDLVGILGTANRGTLVQPPRQLGEVALQDGSGAPVDYADLGRKWALLVPGAGARCDAACEHSLYMTRQIHIAMGKEAKRIRRLYLSDSAPAQTELAVESLSDGHPAPHSFTDFLRTEHPGLQALQLAGNGYGSLFIEHQQDPAIWYLVDPAGWIMMRYDAQTPHRDVMADLKFLLKNSSE
jgi:cytochrome oxidase Cu insertion factor (SCO1/SenC/PrrC family)